ncbi:HTH_Tnp_Tc3_2 domain-containing protein [Trichonephila clavipes]|nr:HTH_Tnp_Tc3_2 domain-containing protein [Trichonephila clavipes]
MSIELPFAAMGDYDLMNRGETEIIIKVKEGPDKRDGKLFRPSLEDVDIQDYVLQTITECWSENPEQRPDFRHVKEKLKRMKEGIIIIHILKKNMQITGNHQMAWIVRHYDESVGEGYIRNGGKEVKLFTSNLKAFQCNNRVVMAQRKHLDDFLLVRKIGRLEYGRTQLEVSEELGIAQSVISRLWQRFQDDGNVSRCYSTGCSGVTTPNDDQYIYLAVTAKRNRRSTVSDLSRQLSSATGRTVSRQTVYRRLGHIVYMLVGLSDVFHLPQCNVACD